MSTNSTFNTTQYGEYLSEAKTFVQSRIGNDTHVALVLGSGLGPFVERLSEPVVVPYSKIPHMPMTTVPGHHGKLVCGHVSGLKVICLAGRVHPYEGLHMHQLVFATCLLRRLGVKLMIATNASGGAALGMEGGDVMAITDHMNLTFRSPLEDLGGALNGDTSFQVKYSERMLAIARASKDTLTATFWEGIYGFTTGPSFETPSEVRTFSKIGASVFGMSTVPEVTVAYHVGMEIFAMSLITNAAAGISTSHLTHDEVQEKAKSAGPAFEVFLAKILSGVNVSEIEDRPAFSSEISSEFVRSLPVPSARECGAPASVKTFAKAVGDLRDSSHVPSLVVVLGSDLSLPCLGELSGVKTAPLSQLSFPARTSSGLSAFVTVAYFSETEEGVVVFWGARGEGFSSSELKTFCAVARCLGISRVIQVVTAPFKDNTVFGVAGSVAFTQDVVFPLTLEEKEAYGVSDQEEVATRRFGGSGEPHGSVTDVAFVGVFPGPSLFTQAEYQAVSQIGLDLCVNNVLIHDAAASLRVSSDVLVVGNPDWSLSPPANTSAVEKWIVSDSRKQATSTLASQSSSTDGNGASATVRPVFETQGDVAATLALRDEAAGLLTAAGVAPLVAVFFDSVFTCQTLKDLGTDVTPSLFRSRGEIWLASASALLVFGSPKSTTAILLSEVVLSARVISLLPSIRAASVVMPVSPTTQTAARVFVVEDHVNFSGRNPLFGKNVEEWGSRFIDMTEVYRPAWVESICNKMEDDVEKVKALFVASPNVYPAPKPLASWACDRGLSVITDSLIPQVIVMRHSGKVCCGVGIAWTASSTGESVEELLRSVVKGLEL